MRKLRLFFCGRLFSFALIAFTILAAGILLSLWLPRILAPIALLERLFSLAAALVTACDRTPPQFKISKIVLIVFLPWTGAILCFLFLSRAKLPRTEGKKADGFFPSTLRSAEYFPVGREMYEKLLADLSSAKKCIWLEFYIVAEGVFWSDVLAVLEQKAAAGVDVRLIYDGFGSALTLPERYQAELEGRGIKAYCFRPIRFPSRKAGRRDHRKIAVIDGEIGYTGGVNLADEYIGETIRFGHWKDTALRVTGRAAGELAALFAKTWNYGNAARPVLPPNITGGTIPCAVVADGADETALRAGQQLLLNLFSGAKKRLYVNTPYLAPDHTLLQALIAAARFGADVRLMIPHIPDKKLPFLLTRSYARELQKCGVLVREYTDGFLHAKSVVSDNVAFVSSYNLDFRSLYLQAECGVAVASKRLAEDLARDFLNAWEGGTPLPESKKAAAPLLALLRLAAPLF